METKFNFNSSPCTSIEQSERLLALGLKKETADMKYRGLYLSSVDKWYNKEYPEVLYDGEQIHGKDIPAWSLHRLIEMMPKKVITPTKGHYYRVLYNNCIGYEIGDYSIARFFGENLYDKIISCIEWQIKKGYFNKEYLV